MTQQITFDGLSYREMAAGAYKCLAGERASPMVQEARLALCAACPESRLGLYMGGALLQCGKCQCLLGELGPVRLTQLRIRSKTAAELERLTRASLRPFCKPTVASEACPLGKWLGQGSTTGGAPGAVQAHQEVL